MTLLAAIDPGLDVVAAALFETDKLPLHPQLTDVGRAFVCYEVLATPPKMPLWERLYEIGGWPTWLRATWRVERLLIEEPAIWGAYAGQRRGGVTKNPAAMGKFWMALGALLAGAKRADLSIQMVKAFPVSKEQRALAVQATMGVAYARGPKGGRHQDVLDATFLGLWHLTHP